MVDGPPGVDACSPCALPASCLAIKQGNPSAPSGVYAIDLDGLGPGVPFEVDCEMTMLNGGWTLVARERTGVPAGAAGPLRYLGIDTLNPSALAAGTDSGIIGTRFGGAYAEIAITWGPRYIRFAKPVGFDMFGNVVDTSVNLSGLSTSENQLMGWLMQGGGAELCIATRATDVRPGDTSWAIKARLDNNEQCGYGVRRLGRRLGRRAGQHDPEGRHRAAGRDADLDPVGQPTTAFIHFAGSPMRGRSPPRTR
jgi:hypothetical protein